MRFFLFALSLRREYQNTLIMTRFINPFTDIGFKRIFGQELSKPLLIDFLNNLLEGERRIVSLRFLDKEQLPMYDEDRSQIYDIYCELENGEKIIVEMQQSPQEYFKNRAVYYTAEAICRQGEKGPDWKYDIKSIYFVAFLRFRLKDGPEKFRTDVTLMDMHDKQPFSDKVRMIFLQLPYFEKEVSECANDFERWICILKDMEVLKRMPEAAKNSVFAKLAEIADVGSLSREERLKYDYALKKYRDTNAVLDYAKKMAEEEGWAQGRAEGMAEGMAQGMAEGMAEGMAQGEAKKESEHFRILLANGIPVERIAQMFGKTVEEVQSILGN